MAGAFQNDAFQNDAFQTDSGPPPPPAAGNTSINQWAMGPCGVMTRTCMPSSFVDNAHAQIITYGCLGEEDEPELILFDNVRFYFGGVEPALFQLAQLYFGASGTTSGAETNQATFLADHPGLSLETFAGIAAPGGSAPTPAMFSGFTQAAGNGGILVNEIDDAAYVGQPFCVWSIAGQADYVQLTFSPEVNAVGFNWDGDMIVEFRSGTTVLYTQTSAGGGNLPAQFLGYSSGGS